MVLVMCSCEQSSLNSVSDVEASHNELEEIPMKEKFEAALLLAQEKRQDK